MKAYTDLEQSEELSEILPIESADMCYIQHSLENYYSPTPQIGRYSAMQNQMPCWSLTALLSVLPFHLIVNDRSYLFSMVKGFNKIGETYAIKYTIFNTTFYYHITDYHNNPVDAAYEMIIKLHESNIL